MLDQSTGEPMPFVNIILNGDGQSGTNTDIRGRFEIVSDVAIRNLTFSFVGYDPIVIDATRDVSGHEVIVRMQTSEVSLQEVVVMAGENPANRIIREVIRQKQFNHPEKISSFRYTSYNKVIYDFDISGETDSLFDQFKEEVFKGAHVMVMESVTERKFKRPNKSEETILATRVSGFNSPSFAPLATDIQPFSFYEDMIRVIDVEYLNPISTGSLSKYEFHIRDTLYQEADTTFVLSYKPLPGKNFEGLTGLLYVNTDKYAIQNVIAKPYVPGFVDVNIQQQYTRINGHQWFPEQLKFELAVRDNQQPSIGVLVSGTSFIEKVELLPDFDQGDFAIESVLLHPLANDRDSLYWASQRAVPLDQLDSVTYQVMDSLGERYKFDNKLKFFENLGRGKWPIGVVDLDINRLLLFNKYEGVRLGMGLYTNDKLIRNVSIGGYGGYGFKDHTWKFGGEIIGYLNRHKDSDVRLSYHNTLQETGYSHLSYFHPRAFQFRELLAFQMDHIEKTSASVSFRTLRYLKVHAAFNHTYQQPKYLYTYQQDDQPAVTDYRHTDVSFILRYAFNEKLIQSMGQRISMGTQFPVVTLAYTCGFDGLFDGTLEYQRWEARIEQTLRIRNAGQSNLQVNAGMIDQPLPYGLLFTGEGSFVRNWSVLVKNSFMTVTPYEFLSDRYVHLHYSHDFGSLLFHIGKWKPSLSVHQNAGWGRLAHPEYHQGVEFKTQEKGLFETGLQLDNLIRFKYFNFTYIGFGSGLFTRYGPYARGRFWDNTMFTFSMTFSTK